MAWLPFASINLAFFTFLLVGFRFDVHHALPTGAVGCRGGAPAVGPAHLDAETVENGTLTDGDFTVSVDGTQLQVGMMMEVQAGTPHTITVQAGANDFKGVLMRLGPMSPSGDEATSFFVPVTTGLRDSDCTYPEAIGVTHDSAVLKNVATAEFEFEETTMLSLDVTVVTNNDATLSQFYWSEFQLDNTGGCGPTGTKCSAPAACCSGLTCQTPKRMMTTSMMSTTMGGMMGRAKKRCATCVTAGNACSTGGECCSNTCSSGMMLCA